MKIAVLLSAYNPDIHYFDLQIQSLLRQTRQADIYIRFDGGKRKEFTRIEKNIKIAESNERLGIEKSFRKLMELAYKDNCDYFMFCDQDDIWKSDKIERSIDLLVSENGPCLVTTRYELIDSNGDPMRGADVDKVCTQFPSAIFRNSDNGNCMAFNKGLAEIYLKTKITENSILHDSWLHLLAQITAKYMVVEDVCVGYRQHGKNVVGIRKTSFLKKMARTVIKRYYPVQFIELTRNLKNIDLGRDVLDNILQGNRLFISALRVVKLRFIIGFAIGFAIELLLTKTIRNDLIVLREND